MLVRYKSTGHADSLIHWYMLWLMDVLGEMLERGWSDDVIRFFSLLFGFSIVVRLRRMEQAFWTKRGRVYGPPEG